MNDQHPKNALANGEKCPQTVAIQPLSTVVDAPFDDEWMETSDGSRTLYHPRYAQTYHSHYGAITESKHVFVAHSKLAERLQHRPVSLLEIGIGTGLNLVLSATLARRIGGLLHYTGIEQFPPHADALDGLNYEHNEAVDAEIWAQCRRAFSARRAQFLLGEHAEVIAHWQRFETLTLPVATFDIVYHDGFSPDVNEELWTDEALEAIARSIKPGGVLVTYTVQGRLRRALARCSMQIERLPGPPGGKRQVLRATKTVG